MATKSRVSLTMFLSRSAFAALIVCFSINGAIANSVPTAGPTDFTALKTDNPPVIDGHIKPEEWPEQAHEQGFVDKDTNLSSEDPAEFWLSYDEKYIYFAARAITDPTKIFDEEYRQNVSLRGDDNFGISIDPFGSTSNFNTFTTNAAGATNIQLAGGRALKTEWLGEIEASGRKTDTGWECEMRIPWSIMTLPTGGVYNPRFNVYWYRSKKSNTYAWRFTDNDPKNTPRWMNVEIPSVVTPKTIKLLPFFTTSAQENKEFGLNAGLDLKTALTDKIQMVGTISPDFQNIESSVLSLDFSRFERLANDNRPFFQEGSQYIRTGFDQRLFASQRIGRIDAGLNLYGNLTPDTQFGLLSTANFGDQQATVFSAIHRFTPTRNIQLAYVRNDQRNRENQAGQFNYGDRVGDVNIFFNNQYTDDQTRGSGWRNSWGLFFNKDGWEASASYDAVSPNFFPRLGFSPEQNFKGYGLFVTKEVTPAHGPFNGYSLNGYGFTYDRMTGGFYRNSMGLEGQLLLRNNIGFGFGANWSNFLGTADHSYAVALGFPYNNPYRNFQVRYETAEYDGHPYKSYGLDATYKPLKRFQLGLRAQLVEYTDFGRQYVVTANYDIDRYQSVGGRLVQEGDRTNWYLSYRMSGKRGAEYFLIIGDPRANQFANRIAFKMTLPLEIKY